MRKPRYWTSLLIIPEADIAFGPLPLPGVEVEVNNSRHLRITGGNYSYHFRLPNIGSVSDAVKWVDQDITQRGFSRPQWVTQDSIRFFFVKNNETSTPTILGGMIYPVESEGDAEIIVVVENQEIPRKREGAETSLNHMFKSAQFWIRPIKYPDDAIVHASLQSHTDDLDLRFELPAGTVPRHFAFGMIQTERIGRYGPDDYCRFIADGIIARNGDETRYLAEELANDPGVRDAKVRMVDSEVAEISGCIIDKRKKESTLRCRMVPAEEGTGLLIATLTLNGEDDKESKKLLATVTKTVDTQGATPRPIPGDVPQNAIDALMVIDSFRQRENPKKQ